MAQSSHARKQLMTFCCGETESARENVLSSHFGSTSSCQRQTKATVTLNSSACSLPCMFLCAALRSPNICGSFASKLEGREKNFKMVRWRRSDIYNETADAELRESLLLFTIIRGTGYFGTRIVQDVWHKIQPSNLWDQGKGKQKSSIWLGYFSFTDCANTVHTKGA